MIYTLKPFRGALPHADPLRAREHATFLQYEFQHTPNMTIESGHQRAIGKKIIRTNSLLRLRRGYILATLQTY